MTEVGFVQNLCTLLRGSTVLLAVPLIVYISLVEPIIRATRYFLERHPRVFPQRGRLVEWFSISHTYLNSLKETSASANIERVSLVS